MFVCVGQVELASFDMWGLLAMKKHITSAWKNANKTSQEIEKNQIK